ncbi:MAG: TraB/GumN family protein [Methanosarcinaceae archaeon]
MDAGNNITDSQIQDPKYDLHTTSQSHFIGEVLAPESISPTQNPPSRIIIVGTAHVSEKSVAEVIETIEREQPDIVAVELCKGRYDAIKGKAGVSKIPIKDLLSEGKVYFFLVHWLLAYVQKKIGDDMGVKPGAEMISAIDAAERSGASVALIDRDIQVTLQRFWGKMRLIEKLRMGGALIGAALGFGGGTDIDIDNITDKDMVTMLTEELRGIAPTAAEVLIDERDAYIAGNLVRAAAGGGKKIVAVVGAGHKAGIEKYLKAPQTIPAPRSLLELPKKRFGFMKFIGFGIVGIAIATFAMLILSGTPLKLLLIAFGWWFIINGVLSAAGAILARGHPYSVLTAFSVAWLTSLNPMMAAGWFAGLMEAKQRNPTTEDFKMLVEVETTSEMMNNDLFRVILVAAFANIGSMIGTFLGVYVVIQVAGIDPRDVISAGFASIGI